MFRSWEINVQCSVLNRQAVLTLPRHLLQNLSILSHFFHSICGLRLSSTLIYSGGGEPEFGARGSRVGAAVEFAAFYVSGTVNDVQTS